MYSTLGGYRLGALVRMHAAATPIHAYARARLLARAAGRTRSVARVATVDAGAGRAQSVTWGHPVTGKYLRNDVKRADQAGAWLGA